MCSFVSPAMRPALVVATAGLGLVSNVTASSQLPPPGFKIAFLGDQNDGESAYSVLELVRTEEAHAVLHLGDFDYSDHPANWDGMINDVLSPGFPYFACVGNHDKSRWKNSHGYQHYLIDRMQRLGLSWSGDLGVMSCQHYEGICIVLAAPSIYGDGDEDYAPYVAATLAADRSAWRIAGWHVNQEAMQIGDKHDQAGWLLYEESRKAGAIVATGHSHEYGRTFPLSNCEHQVVASTEDTFALTRDNPATFNDEGVTFVFHTGLGGSSIREQDRCLPALPPYGCNGEWASIYAEQQGGQFGALFGEFHVDGDPCRAHFYFKDIEGVVIDEFWVTSTTGPCSPCPGDIDGSGDVGPHDVISLISSWGGCAVDARCDGDLDFDGVTGFKDLMSLLTAWGPCPPRSKAH